jgi:hypothetical protein
MFVLLFAFWSMAYDTPKILSVKDRRISSSQHGVIASISTMPDSPSNDLLGDANNGHEGRHISNGSNGRKAANQKTPLLSNKNGGTSDVITSSSIVPTASFSGSTSLGSPISDNENINAPIVIEAKEELTLWGAMKTAKYWSQFFTTTFGVGGGLLVIYNITQMVEAQGGEDVIILLTLLTILIPLLLLLLLLVVV